MTPALYINEIGNIEAVDPSKVNEAESLGWVPASAEQARDYFLAQKYGTTGQAAVAGLESFASMLTLGGSTWLEKAAGVDPEGIAAREKYNPLASGTGSAVGVLAPLLFTGGASAGAQGAVRGAASMTGPSLLAALGKQATKAALRELPATAPLAQRVAAKGFAAAAGGAVEGAGYEVGQLVHEAALGDPSEVAEMALARIGLSAVTFGALTGGSSILGTLAGEAFKGTGGSGAVREKLLGWLENVEARSAGKAAGGIQQDIKKLRQKLGGEGSNAVLREMGERGLVDWHTTPHTTAERAQALMDRAGATMGDVLRAADDVGRAEGQALGDLGAFLKRARAEVLDPLKADPYQKEAAGRLESLLVDLGQRKALVPLEELHSLRRMGDQALYGMRGTMDPYATAYKQALHDLRGLYSEAIETGVTKSGHPLDIWKTANREYQVGATALEFAEKGIERSMGNNVFGLSSALWGGVAGTMAGGPLGGLGGTIATELLRRQGSGIAWRASRGLRGLLEGEGAAIANGTARAVQAERQAAFNEAHAAGLSAAFGGAPAHRAAGLSGLAQASIFAGASGAPETAAALAVLARAKREVTKEVDGAMLSLLKGAPRALGKVAAVEISGDVAEQARRLAASPELLQDSLVRATGDLHPHAPGVSQAAQVTAARAAAFLAMKAPVTALPGLHAKGAKPSAYEMGKFRRYAEVVEKPLKALKHARQGTLTPEHVAAVRMVYPRTYLLFQERLLEMLAGNEGKTISPQSRMMLSMLTGFRLDASLAQNAIAANQAAYVRPAERPMDQARPNPNAGALKDGQRAATQRQKADYRLGSE